MRNWKRGLIVFGIVVMSVVILLNFDGDVTGNVVWEPVTVVENCSDVQMQGLWGEVFVRSSGGATLLDSEGIGGGGCARYMFEIDDSEMWLGFVMEDRAPEGIFIRGGDWFNIINSTNIGYSYFNSTYNITQVHGTPTTNEEVQNLILTILLAENINNWSISSISEAEIKFAEYFKVIPEDWVENLIDEGYEFDEENSTTLSTYTLTGGLLMNYSYASFSWQEENFEEIYLPVLIQNISDLAYEVNSSWNYAFDVTDHFDFDEGDSFAFADVGVGNDDGDLINYTFTNQGVSFKPALGFKGSKEFRIVVIDVELGNYVYSNYFNVTIVEDLNNAPVLIKEFSMVDVPRGGEVKLYLDVYFEDPDGDDMTYRVSDSKDLKVNITGDIMIIKLNESFNESLEIFIYASDGTAETKSDWFWVFEKNESVTLVVENASEGDNLSVTVGDGESVIGNVSGDSAAGGDESDMGWILWVLLGVVIVGILLFVVWFFTLRKDLGGVGTVDGVKPAAPSGPPTPVVEKNNVAPGAVVKNVAQVPAPQVPQKPTSVKSYLEELNLSKK